MPSTTESASRPVQRTVSLGVKGLALSHHATADLAIAHLRPTIPEHGIHRHQHDDMHLVLVLEGTYVSDAAGMPDVCAEPALILNPPGTEHRDRFRSRDGLFLTLTMPTEVFRQRYGDARLGDGARRLPRQALSGAMRLLPEVRRWSSESALAVESVFSEVLADARPTCADQDGPADRLHRVLERLEAIGMPLPSIQELAALSGYHPVSLARAFRRRYGIGPADYIRKRRVHQAVSLIARGRSLAHAAAALGFVDQSHLHRSFVAEYAMTPGAFRRLALGQREVARIQDARLTSR